MRFDDMLATVLQQPTPDRRSLGLQWRQLVDLLAQRRDATPSPIVERAYATLIDNRARLSLGERMEAARALAGQKLGPRLVSLFANDHAAVAAPVLRAARLDEAAWIALLPALGPTARALLRHREDLEPAVRRALEGFGPADLVIEAPTEAPSEVPSEPPPGIAPPGSPIRELVDRIEAFRQMRDADAVEDPPLGNDAAPAEFRWECDVEGVLSWAEGGNRGALIGLSIVPADAGVDAGIAAAFASRKGFRDGWIVIADGEWRISGVPLFDGASGRFLGYRGTGRRAPVDGAGSSEAGGGLMGTALPTLALREMVHELRTPLNAIIGFAEMIDGQYLGPAGQRQRERAGDIRDQANRLVRALEDLDLAAKLDAKFDAKSDGGRVGAARGSVDLAALVVRMHDAFEAMAKARGVALAVEITSELPPATMDPDAAERLITRLLGAAIGVAADGETVLVRLSQGPRGRDLVLAIDRPRTIRGPGAAAMLDPGYAPPIVGSDAPALGLGFALRLIRNLARSAGGDLAVEPDAFLLSLPSQARNAMPSDQRR